MVHGIHLENGQALSYINRWVKTATLARAQGQDVEADTPANTNIIRLGDQLLALCEGGVPHQMTNDLTTVGPQDFGGTLPGGHMTARPKFDAATGKRLRSTTTGSNHSGAISSSIRRGRSRTARRSPWPARA